MFVRRLWATIHRRIHHVIKPNPQEEELFSLLRRVTDERDTTLRVAGGWVRNKVDLSVINIVHQHTPTIFTSC
jgi:hypothetical protein